MKIDVKEVKRYLRIHGNFDEVDEVIDKISQKATSTLCPNSIVNKFDIAHTQNGIQIVGTDVCFDGQLIKKVFDGCDEMYMFVATLTLASETLLRQCFAKSAVDGVVCDSILTTMIESYCDDIEDAINNKVATDGKIATKRISCGYGDFALDCQKDILNLLGATKFLGITLNQNNMMYPNKTVTAVLGVKKRDFANLDNAKVYTSNNQCDSCGASCNFKRDL